MFMVADGLNAPRDGKQQQHETRFSDCHCQKVQCGMQHSKLTMEAGGMDVCHRHNYLTRDQFPEKIPGGHLFI